MVAVRTPNAPKKAVRSPVQMERTNPSGPSTTSDSSRISNVRRSIDKLEAAGTHAPPRLSITPKRPVDGPSKTKLKLVLPQTNRVERSPPKAPVKIKSVDRKAEAEACVKEIGKQLDKSRNMNGVIKKEIQTQADRLLQLIKEVDLVKRSRPSLSPTVEGNKTDTGMQTADEPTAPNENQALGKADMDCFSKRLFERLEEQAHLIAENTQRMENLKDTIERQDRATYATVAGLPKKQKIDQAALHSVVVSAKDETETGEEIIQRIRAAVNAKEGEVTVERIRKAKDRKVIVGCRTKEEREKVREKLKKAEDHLIVEEVKNKNPLVVLRNLFNYNTNEDVIDALWAQNRKTLQDLDRNQTKMEVLFRKKTRNPQTGHVVIRVSPSIWRRLIDAGSVMIDLQRVTVADQSPLIQCSMCLGYGHGRRFCKDTVEKCSHCGGPHMKSVCEDWNLGREPKCTNCVCANQSRVDHNAFSDECAVRKKWEALARSTVAYC